MRAREQERDGGTTGGSGGIVFLQGRARHAHRSESRTRVEEKGATRVCASARSGADEAVWGSVGGSGVAAATALAGESSLPMGLKLPTRAR